MKSVDICGIKFQVQNYDDAIDVFDNWIKVGATHQVCIANVHTVVTALRDPAFHNVNSNADMVTMDGQPLRWYANLVYGANLTDRVCGPELLLRCIEHGLSKSWSHYFYGGHEEILKKLQERLIDKYPGLVIAGAYSPPFRNLSEKEDKAVVSNINKANPDFLWVGLGAPKQERWIADHLERVNVPVQVGVGAAFDFHAGYIDRAPRILQKSGLEWLFRVWKDPRLWKRYLSTNPVFLYVLLRDWFRRRVLGKLL